MSIELDYKLFESLEKLILYQNIILLKKIASDKYWDFQDLKKFIPQAMAKTLINSQTKQLETDNSKPEPNFKIIKRKKIKKKVTKEQTVEKKKKGKKIIKKKTSKVPNDLEKTNKSDELCEKTAQTILEDTGINNDDDSISVQLVSYNSKNYYWESKTDRVYELDEELNELSFVGMKEHDSINFDAESTEEI